MLELIFTRTTQHLKPLMKNKRQLSRLNTSILGLIGAAVAADQLFGNKLITVSMAEGRFAIKTLSLMKDSLLPFVYFRVVS